MTVLAINAGSSTLKFAVYPAENHHAEPAILSGAFDGLGGDGPLSLVWSADGVQHSEQVLRSDGGGDAYDAALAALQSLLQGHGGGLDIRAVAHRIVHGGKIFRRAVVVDDGVLQQLDTLCSLAPLHQPHNLQGVRAFARAFPGLPQVACFDTAFHADVPDVEYNFALPQALAQQGIRRYGFHGLSYQYVLETLTRVSPLAAQGRAVMAHLGSGASVCACRGGRSQATSMGFSALDGLMMGTRSGALDAGVVLHLLAQGWDHARLEKLLYKQSGLLGVSGVSGDMRRLRSLAATDAQADLAIRMFTHRVVRETGAMVASVGGLDLLVSNAGRQQARDSILDLTSEEFDATMKTNIYAPFWIIRAAVRT